MNNSTAIVLAMFGTADEEALPELLNIRDRVTAHFTGLPVHIAFTSAAIRRTWRQRAGDDRYRRENRAIPPEIMAVRGPLEVVAGLREQGCNCLVVQPVFMTPGQEYHDLLSMVAGFRTMTKGPADTPLFGTLAVGRPVMGTGQTGHPSGRDIALLARILGDDVRAAREQGAGLLYMGHGSRHQPSGDIYLQLLAEMRRQYQDVSIHLANVESKPSLTDILPQIREEKPEKILLKPLLIAAGRHVRRDMAGAGRDAWQGRLEAEGFTVRAVMEGLGRRDAFADIFADRIDEAVRETGIRLKESIGREA